MKNKVITAQEFLDISFGENKAVRSKITKDMIEFAKLQQTKNSK